MFADYWEYRKKPEIMKADQKIDLSNITCMGSCFAKNIARWLNFQGLTQRTAPWDTLFNPYSIFYEIKRLYECTDWQEGIIQEKSGNKKYYRDPWRTWHRSESLSDLTMFNQKFDQEARAFLSGTSSIIITYGLSEIWYAGTNEEIVLNQVPVQSNQTPDRWKHKFADVNNVIEVIVNTIEAIRKYIGKSLPVILTLSPVPLKCTASNISVREANTLSKSILCTAIHKACELNNVYYFPSYEWIFALSEDSKFNLWQEDGRHVSACAVNEVASVFVNDFCCLNHPINTADFWVPLVSKHGKIIGKLYDDGKMERTHNES